MDDCHIKREQCNEGVGGGVASISKGWGAGNGFCTFSAILHPLALFTSRSAGVSVCASVCVILHAPAQFSKISVSKVKVMTLSLRTHTGSAWKHPHDILTVTSKTGDQLPRDVRKL